MSRTRRSKKTKGRKMKSYALDQGNKFYLYKTDHVGGYSKGVSSYDKLITRNANRSLKKGLRFKLKLETKELLNDNTVLYN